MSFIEASLWQKIYNDLICYIDSSYRLNLIKNSTNKYYNYLVLNQDIKDMLSDIINLEWLILLKNNQYVDLLLMMTF